VGLGIGVGVRVGVGAAVGGASVAVGRPVGLGGAATAVAGDETGVDWRGGSSGPARPVGGIARDPAAGAALQPVAQAATINPNTRNAKRQRGRLAKRGANLPGVEGGMG
jgi:hypothetical protein